MSRLNLHYMPGKRAVKSAISVMLCMLYGLLTQRRPVVATIAALVCLKPTAVEGKKSMWVRLFATFIGGLLGYLLLVLGAHIPGYREFWFVLLVPAGVLLSIYFCNVLGVKEAVVLSGAILVIIAISFDVPQQEMLLYALGRELDTAVGAIFGMGINVMLWNPNKQKREDSLCPTGEAMAVPKEPVSQQDPVTAQTMPPLKERIPHP